MLRRTSTTKSTTAGALVPNRSNRLANDEPRSVCWGSFLFCVAPRMFLPPFPLRTQYRSQVRYRGLPVQHGFGLLCVRDKARRIARARPFNSRGDRAPRDFASAFNHFHHGISVPGSQIQEIGFAAPAKIFERENMRFGKVGDVHIVPDRRSIRRRIVCPKNSYVRLFT